MKKLLFILLASLFGFSAQAVTTASPLGFSLINPVQVPPDNFSIIGARFSLLYGQHRNVKGLDFSLIGNNTEQEFRGSAISGVFNHTQGDTNIIGVQLAGVYNYNKARSSVYGLQAAIFANLGDYTDIYGLQVGLYNRAREVYGVQIGLINYAYNLHGLQIGLLNFNVQGWFGMAPLINFGF